MRSPTIIVLCAAAFFESGAAAHRQAVAPGPLSRNKFGLAAPRPRAEGTVRIACYNVLNLFDHVDDPRLSGEQDDMLEPTSAERCRALADVIRAVDADLIGLEEVESKEALVAFRDEYLKDMGYRHVVSEDVGYYRGVECSLLSRFPVDDVRIWPALELPEPPPGEPGWSALPSSAPRPMRYQRSPLCATVRIKGGYELTVFVLHHKAGNDFKYHREREALATTGIVREMLRKDPDRNVLIMGDFNAAPWDKSLRMYPASGLVDAMAHRVVARGEDDQTESNLYKTHESGRVLDYVFLSAGAYQEYVVGSSHVVGTLFDPEYDYRTDPHPAGYASDHYPVVIDIVPKDSR